ncbi:MULTISPECIES: hypothetical protein [unclassified Pseudomonas]|uniref:hypothetical protein n=1 Tax=unclassified Pseudomonas TaxID=196821 RepID=UPI000A1E44D8|nr:MULTISPECIES: hypothetical protein [unclassified Pseudomonas]
MKKSIAALAVSATLVLTVTVANASVHPTAIQAPQTVNPVTASLDTPFGTQAKAGEIKLASLARSCSDERYSWWEYSGWEIVGCLVSGQW